MKIKATDLMLGDWVTFADALKAGEFYPIQITSLTLPDRIAGYHPDPAIEGSDVYGEDDLAGIPLNPHLFVKLGWKIRYGDKAKKFPMYATWMVDTSIMFEYYFHEGILREYWCSDEAFATFPAGMNYLHQLQHALRLCGIEKEIEL